MPVFALPLALFALSALPLLAAVYFLSSRHQKRVVSSLILWPKDALPKGGGRKTSRFRSSWLLILEILILILLALAAAAPLVGLAAGRRGVCVVLDDRIAMRAHDASGASARARALAALVAELDKAGRWEAHVVVAGVRPLSVGSAQDAESLKELLGAAASDAAKWSCQAESSDIPAALSLAGQTAPAGAVSVVVTDREAPADLAKGVRWISAGSPLPNLAVTAAARGRADDGAAKDDRVMVEVANFSAAPVKAPLVVERETGPGAFAKVNEAVVPLEPGRRETVVFRAPPEATLRIRLAQPDALAEDDAVVLLPEPHRALKAKLEVKDADLREALSRAFAATGVQEVASGEQLLVSDAPEPMAPADPKSKAAAQPAPQPLPPTPGVWEWRFSGGSADDKGKAYTGPFILQRGHPLVRGLSLEGVVWGAPSAGASARADEEEVVGLGDRALWADRLYPGGEHRLRMSLVTGLSTLAQTPAFPVMVANLADWRLAHEPGLARANWRQGDAVRVAVPARGAGPWRLDAPGAPSTEWRGGPVFEIPAARRGAHRFASADGKTSWPFQVNLCNADASDLRQAVAGAAGAWPDVVKTQGRFKPAFILILVALGLLMLHAWLARRGAEGIESGAVAEGGASA